LLVTGIPLNEDANTALLELKERKIRGAKVLRIAQTGIGYNQKEHL
jgi:hypothetical protein